MTTLYYLSISLAILAAILLFAWAREIILHERTEKLLHNARHIEECLKWRIGEQEKAHDKLLTKLRENGVEVGELK